MFNLIVSTIKLVYKQYFRIFGESIILCLRDLVGDYCSLLDLVNLLNNKYIINLKGPLVNGGSKSGNFLVLHGKWNENEINLNSLYLVIP